MYKLSLTETSNFLGAQMSVLSRSFTVLIVLGICNFAHNMQPNTSSTGQARFPNKQKTIVEGPHLSRPDMEQKTCDIEIAVKLKIYSRKTNCPHRVHFARSNAIRKCQYSRAPKKRNEFDVQIFSKQVENVAKVVAK